MTSFTAMDYFSHELLTPIPLEEKPSFPSLKIIHQELNANAMAVQSTLGGGQYGHLSLTISSTRFNALPDAAAFVIPVHPVVQPAHAGNATAAQIAETNRLYKESIERFLIYKATGTALKKQLLQAIPDTFTNTLKNDLFGYTNVTVLQILDHLDTAYGSVDQADLKDNIKRMEAEWSPNQPIEELFNQIKAAQQFAADHDPITEKTALRAATTNFENSGTFTEALREWNNKAEADQTWTNLESHFKKADKARRRILTASEVGYANAAISKVSANAKTSANAVPMWYCWSHGLGPNMTHTSINCTKPVTGHRKEATVDNMMGGCYIIKRRNGERAIYRRPPRNPRNDENAPPSDQTATGNR
ncbi:hypothetical protein SEMRO_1524_G279590.1 [Seminavis robusta]|uniref:Uncharacterized protein n=1 Tax=Seminavis robusta TaxID=568900 RepID=A0A9N8ENF5_9STRA|nr:hypothetical protein SEMRO_1524_G279590.1 [Seminavis robusta]|eukprot:Sro1524_g279590.1 n/a (361) ;mRNA; f:7637-8719